MTLTMPDGAVTIDPHLGKLRGLRFWDGRKWLDPLRAAGRSGSVDFSCGPCGGGHGWTADSPWELREVVQSGRAALARLSLGHVVQGASVEKELSLRKGEPILYQSHLLSGGQGVLNLSHHPVVRMADGGQLSFSPKQPVAAGELMPCARDLPAQQGELASRCARGGPVELGAGRALGAEARVTLVEATGNSLAWTAVLRHAEQDIVFVLRDPGMLPVTMLWHAEGGRVLGIGDGCAPGSGRQRKRHAECGTGGACPLSLAPSRVHRVRHAIGAVPCPADWTRVTAISIDQNTLRLEGDGDGAICLPFDGQFFGCPS
ncbi:MAG: hypothetical protein ACP5DX_07495 [Paracoccaceae bacterium]